MKVWKLMFRAKSLPQADLMPAGLRKDMALIGRLTRCYVVDVFGTRFLGFEFETDSEDFNHVCRLIKILEVRYTMRVFEFSEKSSSPEAADLLVKIDSRPTLKVA
ncbi:MULTISPECIES: hypothetical protein [Modicisalibacter]|uniref:Uncharacterized protein n=1 Tax=Modicisalibacter tunisiensis TaxID=390637 RepID=A0ABS7X0G2_9GAMM|nr:MULTISPECIES: hypothetical protein [Modicisalibacter]MBZ9539119.1 hypothetical protein [Modicisalibacter tunisiensis]MBZ9567487.1 hypothetical protein [Modicisalibacter tunisiensis]